MNAFKNYILMKDNLLCYIKENSNGLTKFVKADVQITNKTVEERMLDFLTQHKNKQIYLSDLIPLFSSNDR
eukprot:UN03516